MKTPVSPIKILLVDDNQDVLDVIGMGLEMFDYCVATCANGADAVKQLSTFHPDVVIVDQGLPDICGIELGAQIRATLADSPPVRLALLTGTEGQEIRDRAQRAGFDGFFVKPVRINTISEWIESGP